MIYTTADRALSKVWTNAPSVGSLEDLVGKPVGVGGQRPRAIQAGSVAAVMLLATETVGLQEAIPTAPTSFLS
jgi:hypothetical protein